MSRETKYTFSRPADLPGIEILSAEHDRRLWKTLHSTYTVCTVYEASGFSEWCYRRRRYVSAERHVMAFEPGETHVNTRATSPASFHVLLIDPALVSEFAEDGGAPCPHIAGPSSADVGLFTAVEQFHRAQEDGAPLLERETRLWRAVERMLACCAEQPLRTEAAPARAGLYRVRDYLHAHAVASPSLADLARLAGLSRFHFLRSFAREFGIPPHAYQTAVRVEQVRTLLGRGVPLGEVEAGFADQSHLIRHFKRVWGVTPARYTAMVHGDRVPATRRNNVLSGRSLPLRRSAPAGAPASPPQGGVM